MTTPKIIKVEKSKDGNSYQIDFGDKMVLWFDTYKDSNGELIGEWNKYIFKTSDKQDMKEKAFQDANDDNIGAYNYMTALELCEEYQNNLDRLEYLRSQLDQECISYGELAELADLKDYIEPDDVQLLEAAGVPEFNN